MTITSLSRLLADPASLVGERPQAPDRGNTPACRIGSITNTADNKVGEVFIYGTIDPFGWDEVGDVSANSFVRELAALDVDQLTVRINSPGGDVYDALAITNALKSHPAKVTTIIEGLAASAASFIAQAGDTVIIRPNAEMMIHDPRGFCIGNPDRITEYAKWLDRAADNIAAIYADRAGGDPSDWRDAMRAETWYSAAEAVKAGLADETTSGPAVEAAEEEDDRDHEMAAAAAAFGIRYQCRAQAPAPFMPTDVGRQKGSDMALRQEIAARLGIAEDADESTVLNKIDELTELATAPADTSPSQIAALAEAHGLRVIDSAQFDQLESELTALREQAAEQDRAARNAVVDDAIRSGKITAGRRDHWIALIDADPDGTTELLNQLPDQLAVPTREAGHNPVDETDISPYDELFKKES